LLAKGVYSLLQLCSPCSFPLYLLLYDLSSFHRRPSSGHLLLHEPEMFIFLAKVCKFVLYDSFDFLLRVLVLIMLSFGFLVWVLIVVWQLLRRQRWEIRNNDVGCEQLRLGRWLPCWAVGPPCVGDSSMGFSGRVWVACLGYVGS
jgi:hypothetical protein